MAPQWPLFAEQEEVGSAEVLNADRFTVQREYAQLSN
jgi:hypothetical protein